MCSGVVVFMRQESTAFFKVLRNQVQCGGVMGHTLFTSHSAKSDQFLLTGINFPNASRIFSPLSISTPRLRSGPIISYLN